MGGTASTGGSIRRNASRRLRRATSQRSQEIAPLTHTRPVSHLSLARVAAARADVDELPVPRFIEHGRGQFAAVHASRVQPDRAAIDLRLLARRMAVHDQSIAVPDFGPEGIAGLLLS